MRFEDEAMLVCFLREKGTPSELLSLKGWFLKLIQLPFFDA